MSEFGPLRPARLTEAGLRLRPWRTGDADSVYRACQDPLIQRWTNVPNPYLREHAEAFVTGYTQQSWHRGDAAPFGVFDAGTEEMLGACGLVTLNRGGGVAELGYWVAPWARGRRVGTDAARALCRWSFDALGIQRLIWRAPIGNHASRLIAERLGFQLEGIQLLGIRRPDGTRRDCWSGALLPGQLREADAPDDPVKLLQARTFGQSQPTIAVDSGVTIRPTDSYDLDAIYRCCQDPESLRWTTVPSPYTHADAEHFVRVYAPGSWARGDGAIFAIADAQDAYVGSMHLRLNGPRTADVGYLVAPWARGRGYASAALTVLCDWGFTALGLDRIEWRAYVGNEASRRVAENAGFVVEGIARASMVQRGEYRDAWVGARTRPDLVTQKA